MHLNAPCLHAVCRMECGRFSGETHRCIDGDKTLHSLKNMTVQPVSVFLIKNRKGGVHNMLSLHDLTCGLDPETGPETGFWRISLQLLTMKPAEDIHDLQRMNLFSLTSPSGQFSTSTQ